MATTRWSGGGEGNPPRYVSLGTFKNIWEREYPWLKVSGMSEDICSDCFMFANRHKFLADHSAASVGSDIGGGGGDGNNDDVAINSAADGALFRGEPEDSPDDDDDSAPLAEAEDECGPNESVVLCTEITADKEVADVELEAVNAGQEGSATNCGGEQEMGEPQSGQAEHAVGNESTSEPTSIEGIVVPVPAEENLETSVFARAATQRDEEREAMLIRSGKHALRARAQRVLYQHYVVKAIRDAWLDTPHTLRTYCFVVDYGQNMELPVYNLEQPGLTYYYSPLSIFNLGVVNHAHKYSDKEPREHMFAHVYHEGVAKKGANNVASLIVKTLVKEKIIREDQIGGELVIVFDNCSGQNKNNTILKLMVFLVECGYFKDVWFVFLIVGHTKNAADRLFNLLKQMYRKKTSTPCPSSCLNWDTPNLSPLIQAKTKTSMIGTNF